MKRYFCFIFISLLCIASCVNNVGGNATIINSSDISNISKTTVNFFNNSGLRVSVYSDSLRSIKLCDILSGKSYEIETRHSDFGVVFYLTYFVNVGVSDYLEIPYFSNESFIFVSTKKDSAVTLTISEPSSMKTRNCYVVIENKSDEDIIFKQGSSELISTNKNTAILKTSENAAYEIKNVYFGNFSSFKIVSVTEKTIPLPSNIVRFDEGYIYSIIIQNDIIGNTQTILKSIEPFDVDVKKQIWSSTSSDFDLRYPITMRKIENTSSDYAVMGTLANDSTCIGLKHIDRYNLKNILYTAKISHSDSVIVTKSSVIDFVQVSGNNFVILMQNEFESGSVHFLICYNFDSKQVKWAYIFPDTDKIIFATESKGKLLAIKNESMGSGQIEDEKVALVGGIVKQNKMHRYFLLCSFDGKKLHLQQYTSPDSTDFLNDTKTIFTSCHYDGNNFYVCGYTDFDFKYSGKNYKGIIYKFFYDLQTVQEIYSCDNTVFFEIVGYNTKAKSYWYSCGEYLDVGKIRKACFISSSMIQEGKNLEKYSNSIRSYSVFNHLCCYENKIVLAGILSDDLFGNLNSLPIVVAFDTLQNKIIFENTNFSSYKKIDSVISNSINTYTAQLQSLNNVHYISADLLGNFK